MILLFKIILFCKIIKVNYYPVKTDTIDSNFVRLCTLEKDFLSKELLKTSHFFLYHFFASMLFCYYELLPDKYEHQVPAMTVSV